MWIYMEFDKKAQEMKEKLPRANAKEKDIALLARVRGTGGRG